MIEPRLRRVSRAPYLFVAATLIAIRANAQPVAATATRDARDTRDFVRQLQSTIPAFLRSSGVPGASVALVRNGRIAYVGAFGDVDREHHRAATSRALFNVGSISKSVTAWGVMRLVEQGRIALDDPVGRYLRRWHLPPARWSEDGVTIRRLLSHTAGLSRPSVHEYEAGAQLPSLITALASPRDDVTIAAEPGRAYAYSGGGYMVLQLLIEEVTHRSFADFMRAEILRPLGMTHSTFDEAALDREPIATPYDSGRAILRHRYAGLAAAGLYTTVEDLAAFAAAELRGPNGEPPGRGLLTPALIALMHTAAPAALLGFGFHYGLGHHLYPLGNESGPGDILGDGVTIPGHMGQNTGWGAVFWTMPSTGDALVVLTNASNGYDAYRWVLCDWLRWAAKPSFGYICRGRQLQTPGPMAERLYASEWRRSPRDSAVDAIVRRVVRDSSPGAAVLVVRDGRVIHSAGYGLADLATRRPVTEDTPFYLASVSKPFTALVALQLVRDGRLALDAPVSRYIPALASLGERVTLERLLTHTSGVPDYYRFIRTWPFAGTLDDGAVIDTLRTKPLDFEPGARAEYSNSNYVLLARAIEHATGQSFASALRERVLLPAGMRATLALDTAASFPAMRAIGYDTAANGRAVVSDYGTFERASGERVHVDLRTVGAGGMFATLRDLAAWDRALWSHALLDSATSSRAYRALVAAPSERGIDTVQGYGQGWVVSRRWDTDVVWMDGAYGGFRNIVLRIPSRRLTVIVLANSAQMDQHALAIAIADRMLARPD